MKITSVVIALSLLIPITLTASAASHRSGSRVHSVRSHVTRRGTYDGKMLVELRQELEKGVD